MQDRRQTAFRETTADESIGSAGGLVATLAAFVWNPLSLYVIRFGLGVAEAGFLFVAAAIAATMRVKPRETELTGAIPSSVAH